MRKNTDTSPTSPAPLVPPVLPARLPAEVREYVTALFRVVIGLLFACHGVDTLFGVPGDPRGGDAPDVGQWPSWWAAVVQLVGGTLVAVGYGARTAAVLCSGSMAYAYFVVHQPRGLLPIENGGEAAAVFCWSFLLIAAVGPGRWSLEALRAGRGEGRAGDRPRS
ncbi:DoxX family membrane protein [Streptomyces sp. TRM43335]|uniref:DoxX family membrane protein n=1 Tax=Streptomyces taklimakanensis TaxID=2569853 RepID=A0A6G2BCX7_9ACTN|nr:DoxX family protein [Streptomyces taklimakanensis]MTE19929.1 DoxX family membrane protein [Streptomyces taklimakanensis]